MYQSHTYQDHSSRTSGSSRGSVTNQTPEPPVNSWAEWVKQEDKVKAPLVTLESRSQKAMPPSPQVNHRYLTNIEKKPSYKPTADQLANMTADMPLCFCKKPAHRSFTKEYGPILECALFNESKDNNNKSTALKKKYTCGFHVHELSWIKLRDAFLRGEVIEAEYPELRACPLYNFTYCVSFHINNTYEKVPPLRLPDCFCGKTVNLSEVKEPTDYRPRHFFVCSGNIESGRKCSWRLEAQEVAFPRAKYSLHTYVDEATYDQHWIEGKSLPPVPILQPQPVKSQHHSELLAALTGSLSTFDDDAKTNNGLVVPTSVLGKKPPPQPTLSVSTSTSSSSSRMKSRLDDTDVDELKIRVLYLEKEKYDTAKKLNQWKTRAEQESDRAAQVDLEYKEELHNLSLDLEEEHWLRVSCQERLSSIELDFVNLMTEKEKAVEELASYRESIRIKYGKEEEYNKCKVCFHSAIEYCLIPCFHFGK